MKGVEVNLPSFYPALSKERGAAPVAFSTSKVQTYVFTAHSASTVSNSVTVGSVNSASDEIQMVSDDPQRESLRAVTIRTRGINSLIVRLLDSSKW
mgnify:CR=1 FL=1